MAPRMSSHRPVQGVFRRLGRPTLSGPVYGVSSSSISISRPAMHPCYDPMAGVG
jgi:hypothetical protein